MLRRLRFIVGMAIAIGLLAVVPAAGAQVVVTLTGETLQTTGGSATVRCGATPVDTATITYDVTGTATGPYPGTFQETGSVTLSAGVAVAYEATFQITSGTTMITGTKTLAASQLGGSGTCDRTVAGLETANATVIEQYQATVSDPSGSFSDSGRATTNLHVFESLPGQLGGSMQQSFASGGQEGMTVTVTPPAAEEPVGAVHTVTATVRDPLGNPVQGINVIFTITAGLQEGSTAQCTTDAAGQCIFSYSGPAVPSADEITACADRNVSGFADSGEPCGAATVAWLAAASTPGTVRGAGRIGDTSTADRVQFGLHADSAGAADPTKGHCSVIDRATGIKIRCLDVTTLVVTPTHAFLIGNALQDKVATTYRIDVDDLDKSGGVDTFKIQTDLGYLAAGPLTNGDITIQP